MKTNGNVVGNHYFVELASILFFIAYFHSIKVMKNINFINHERDIKRDYKISFMKTEQILKVHSLHCINVTEALIIYVSLQH